MKQSENNEIDTLLRNQARRRRAAEFQPDSASRELAAMGAHLDVDELSAYAERALPPSARARCTAHLADCDDCRKIVTQLSLAAGPLTDERRSEPESAVGLTWTQKLATLFSPRMIRYLTPALVLVVVAVAFFGWQRARRSSDYTAFNERPAQAISAKPASQQTSANGQLADSNGKVRETAKTREQKEAKAQPTLAPAERADSAKSEGRSSDEKKPGGVSSGAATATKAGKQDAPAADKAAVEQPTYAPEPAVPAAKPQSSVAANQEQQQKDLAKNNSDDGLDRSRDKNVQRKGPARNDNEVASQRGPAKREAQPVARLKAAEAGSAGGARAEEDDAETRTVLGRHFRRVSSTWVDTAYKSSMSIRSVTRGTEEYRALVADEPVIGSIGRQLLGEVIVVWKGHVYRIN